LVAHLPGALSCMKVNMLGLGFSLMSFFDILYQWTSLLEMKSILTLGLRGIICQFKEWEGSYMYKEM
jgi:hypothetical protein